MYGKEIQIRCSKVLTKKILIQKKKKSLNFSFASFPPFQIYSWPKFNERFWMIQMCPWNSLLDRLKIAIST